MFVIDVIPFSRRTPFGVLSYRCRERLAIGTFVTVPLRKQTVSGLVTSCAPARDLKSILKTASFTLRAGAPRATGTLPAAYRIALEEAARYHARPLGDIVRALLPEAILAHGFSSRLFNGVEPHEEYCEAPTSARYAAYQEKLSSTGTLLVVAPTAVEARRIAQTLHGNAVVVTGEHPPKKRAAAIAAAWHAPAVVTTPAYAFVPIERLAGVVIERESAGGYRTHTIPDIDLRIGIRALARARKTLLMLGDYPLRLEVRPEPSRPLATPPPTKVRVLDIQKKKDRISKTGFAAIPAEINTAVARALAQNKRVVLLAARRSYASAVVCRDCGTTVRDTHGRPLSLATAGGKRILRSADGTIVRDANALCDTCGSWNLLPLGVGVERVAEEAAHAFPDARIVRFDADSVKTPAAAKRAAARFTEPGTIVVGTEAVLPWLSDAAPFAFAAIVSADSLLALPFWRARERLVHLMYALAQECDELLVATRHPDDTALAVFSDHGKSFFEEEASLRKQFHYPPYAHLLIARLQDTPARLDAGETIIRDALTPCELTVLADRRLTATRVVRTLVAKITSQDWPDARRANRAAALPPNVTITVDGESLW